MIEKLIAHKHLKRISRPRFPDEYFWTFDEVTNLFGAANQNIVNAGSSMFVDTPTLLPTMNRFIDKHMDKSNYLLSYFSNHEQYKLFSNNLIKFKQNKELRKIMLDDIIDFSDYSFKENIYPGYLYIVLSLYFMKNNNMFRGKGAAKTLIKKFFKDEETLIEKVFEAIYHEEQLDNLTSVCYGRFYFVDSRLSNIEDLKPVPLKLGDLLVEGVDYE